MHQPLPSPAPRGIELGLASRFGVDGGDRALDLLLGTDVVQRARLAQSGVAMLMLATAVVAMLYFAWAGTAPAGPVLAWSAATLAGMAGFFALVRSGRSRRWADPALTVPQMVFALGSGAVAYSLLGAGRGAVFPAMMVVLMFGVFIVSPRQMLGVSAFAVALFGATMAVMSALRPEVYPPAVEFGHFMLMAAMVPAVSLLAARLARMRRHARMQRAELAQALARLREHTTRDELTGLANRRHMQELMDQERQRCIRSGHTFCLAMIDLDRFKAINEAQGYAVGDALLRAVAEEAQRHVRVSDMLARWGGDEFVLLLGDTRAALARGGLERLHQRVAALRIVHASTPLGVTLSAGLAEHHAGETVEQTLERAERALREAKAQGRDRVVVAA